MAARRRTLIKGLKLWFDFLLIVAGSAVGVILILAIATSFDRGERPDWTVSVPVSLGEGQIKPVFHLDSEGGDANGQGRRIVDGRGELRFDTLHNTLYLGSIAYHVLGGLLALWVIFLLRGILARASRGEPFSLSNVRSLNFMGWIMVAAGTVGPFVERFFVAWVLDSVGPGGVAISPPPLGVRSETILLGLLLLALASVWKEAAAMAEEQSLTV